MAVGVAMGGGAVDSGDWFRRIFRVGKKWRSISIAPGLWTLNNNAISCLKEAGLLGEMADSRSEAENILDEPGTAYCQKPINYELLLGRVISKRFPLAKTRKL